MVSKRLKALSICLAVGASLQLPCAFAYQEQWADIKAEVNQAMLLGDYHRAELLAKRAIFVAGTYGTDASPLPEANATMAKILLREKKHEAAEHYYKKALELAVEQKKKGTQHTEVLTALDDLATAYSEDAKGDMKLTDWQHCLAIYDGVFDDRHPSMEKILGNLGMRFADHHDYEKAIRYLRRRHKIHKKHHEPDTERDAKYLWTLGDCLVATKDLTSADIHYRQSLNMSERLGTDKNYPKHLRAFAAFLRTQKRDAEASEMEAKALTVKIKDHKSESKQMKEEFAPILKEEFNKRLKKLEQKQSKI